jgi:hypothetical protein
VHSFFFSFGLEVLGMEHVIFLGVRTRSHP